MEKLKETIENTLINNIEVSDKFDMPTMASIKTCSDYISKEMQDIAIGYFSYAYGKSKRGNDPYFDEKKTFEEFITDRYKDTE